MSTPATKPQAAATLAALLDERHSCRSFLPDPVPRETIERVVAIAQRTASWCNSQPWQVHLLSGAAVDEARRALTDHARTNAPKPDLEWPQEYRGVYLERRRESGFGLYAALGIGRGDREGAERQRFENFRFFGAPHVAIITSDRHLGVYGAVDCGAYVGTFLLAAQSLNVASIAQAALAAYPGFWRERLGISDDRLIVCGISFGFADAVHPANSFRTGRASTDVAVRWHD